jgi:hypothetical protein
MSRPWSDDEDAIVKRMWADGKTGGEISAQLPGRTRSAIIGRVHRLELESRPDPSLASRTAPQPDVFGGNAFQRLIDRVVDAPANFPVSVKRAAVLEGVNEQVAAALWTILCRKMGPQATPGDFLERRA